MPKPELTIYTIGYEQVTQAELIAALTAAGVERVLDVRALPLSRRPGFSKTALAGGLKAAGIDYRHLRALGTPPEGRAAARRGDHRAMAESYAGQLALPEALVQAAEMRALAAEKPSALLCYERAPHDCHRSLLLAEMAPDAAVIDLFA